MLEIYEQMKETYTYYKKRYENGKNLGITSSSPYYKAFQEIETRYTGLHFCIEFAEHFSQNINEDYLCCYVKLIGETLSPFQIGKKVHLAYDDIVGCTLYRQAKEAKEVIITLYKIGFENSVSEIIENLCKFVQWQLYVRELEFPLVK